MGESNAIGCYLCGVRQGERHRAGCPQLTTTEIAPEIANAPESRRITREDMFFEICEVVRERSSCLRGKVGCVIVREGRIVSLGYNGAPPGDPHCFELGCQADENEHVEGCRRTIHAEANAIVWAARAGISTFGGVMYCTHSPCYECAKLILSSGISVLHYDREYRLDEGLRFLSGRYPRFRVKQRGQASH